MQGLPKGTPGFILEVEFEEQYNENRPYYD